MRCTAGIDVSPHDCAGFVDRAGITVGCSRKFNGDKATLATLEKSTNQAVGVCPTPHDLAVFINLPSERTGCTRNVNRGELAVLQHKAVIIVGRFKASNERIDSDDFSFSVNANCLAKSGTREVNCSERTFSERKPMLRSTCIDIRSSDVTPGVNLRHTGIYSIREVNCGESSLTQ